MPGLRRHFFQLANDAATVVHFNFFITRLAVKYVFIIAFNTQFTDVVRRRVVGQLAVFVQAVHVFIVDLRYVANDVGQRRAVGVIAAFIAFNFDAGKAILINGEPCHLNFTQVSFYRNGGEAV